MSGFKRNLSAKINSYLAVFPCVLLVGARQVGKTTLAKMVRPEWKYFDLEKGSDYDFISSDYDLFFREYPDHVIIDEAQELPQLFRELRGIIDAKRSQKSRFILTGSSSLSLIEEATDSLAGRIGIIEVGTPKVNELRNVELPEIYNIVGDGIDESTAEKIKRTEFGSYDVLSYCLKGTYPEPSLFAQESQHEIWMENYFRSYIDRDIRKLFPKLDSIKYRRFISMLASLSGTIINKAQLGRSIDVSEVTIRDYLEIAEKTLVWRNLPSFEKSKSASVVKMPKGMFRDTGLIHHIANTRDRDQMIRSPQIGQNFESFIVEEFIKGLQALDRGSFDAFYYRTKNGAEVDLVIDGKFGTLPIEVKLSANTNAKQIPSLKRFVEAHDLPLGLVINQSEEIRNISDRILQIPACAI